MTPNLALQDGLLVTASTLANLTGLRGEDEGCNGRARCFQGDMVPSGAAQLQLLQAAAAAAAAEASGGPPSFAGRLWPRAEVKYCFASDIHATSRQLAAVATEALGRALPCLSFTDVGNPGGHASSDADGVKECGEAPAIFIQSASSGCWSYVGMLSDSELAAAGLGAQLLNLHHPGCSVLGTVIHEMLHALGMAHEQARPDRDGHIQILWEHIQSGKERNFDVVDRGYVGAPYDFLSVMHYDARAFGAGGAETIRSLGGAHDAEMGQRVGVSQRDAEQLEAMYRTEDDRCRASNLAAGRTGCDDFEGTECASLTRCSTDSHVMDCCACGGGIMYRCWDGSECREVAPLPVDDHGSCLRDRTAEYGGASRCVAENACSYTVRAMCKARRGYYLDLAPGLWNLRDFAEVCTARGSCSFSRVEEAPPAAAEAAVEAETPGARRASAAPAAAAAAAGAGEGRQLAPAERGPAAKGAAAAAAAIPLGQVALALLRAAVMA